MGQYRVGSTHGTQIVQIEFQCVWKLGSYMGCDVVGTLEEGFVEVVEPAVVARAKDEGVAVEPMAGEPGVECHPASCVIV